MNFANRNTVWAGAFVDELVRAGVREVCLAPGSRSTPLVLAAARDGRLEPRIHVDERSAAFFALGAARADGRPAAVITTSGTATANLHPAVIEASQSGVPLLLLTADRPVELRGTDANQTVDQVDLYGEHVRRSFDVAPPRMTRDSLRYLRGLAARAVEASTTDPRGPVHLNFPFAKPLEPTPVPGDVPDAWHENPPRELVGREDGAPWVRIPTDGRASAPDDVLDELAAAVEGAPRGLIVCGPSSRSADAGPAALELGRATGFPVLADPLSGARFAAGAGESGVAAYDLFLRERTLWDEMEPDLVLRFGPAPTSRALGDFLESADGRHVSVDAGRRWTDHAGTATDRVPASPTPVCRGLASRLASPPADPEWSRRWTELGELARGAAEEAMESGFFEGTVAADVVRTLPADSTLVVGSSMPVRDLDALGFPRDVPLRVLGNRGASGIDGLVSTALGAAARSGGSTVALLGDLSLYHDMNGLLAAKTHDLDVTFVVVNNDGGGIFHMLPIREYEPPFTELFATPHGLDFGHAAGLYGLDHRCVEDRTELVELLSGPDPEHGSAGSRILEVPSDREENRRRHEELEKAVREAVADR